MLIKFLTIIVLHAFIVFSGNCDDEFVPKINLNTYGFSINDSNNFLIFSSVKFNPKFKNNDEEIGNITTIYPLQLAYNKDKWHIVPELYFYYKNKNFGKISMGRYLSSIDIIRVDGSKLGSYNDTILYHSLLPDNKIYSSSLRTNRMLPIQQNYHEKFSYISKENKYMFAASFIPQHDTDNNIFQLGAYYGDSLSDTLSIKTSITGEYANKKYNGYATGINLKYLNLSVGGSVGIDKFIDIKGKYYTTGIGYSLGHWYGYITSMHNESKDKNRIIKFSSITTGVEYRINKEITTTLSAGRLTLTHLKKPAFGILYGVKIAI